MEVEALPLCAAVARPGHPPGRKQKRCGDHTHRRGWLLRGSFDVHRRGAREVAQEVFLFVYPTRLAFCSRLEENQDLLDIPIESINDVDVLESGFSVGLNDGTAVILVGPKNEDHEQWLDMFANLLNGESTESQRSHVYQDTGFTTTSCAAICQASGIGSPCASISTCAPGSPAFTADIASSSPWLGDQDQDSEPMPEQGARSNLEEEGIFSEDNLEEEGVFSEDFQEEEYLYAEELQQEFREMHSGVGKFSNDLAEGLSQGPSAPELQSPGTFESFGLPVDLNIADWLNQWLCTLREDVVHCGFLQFRASGKLLNRFAVLFQDRLDSWDETPSHSGSPPNHRWELRFLSSAHSLKTGLLMVYKSRRIGIHAGSVQEARTWANVLQASIGDGDLHKARVGGHARKNVGPCWASKESCRRVSPGQAGKVYDF